MSGQAAREAGGGRPARDGAAVAALLLAALLALGTVLTSQEGSGPPFPAAPSPPTRQAAGPAQGPISTPAPGAAAGGQPRLAKPPGVGGVDLNRADAEALTALPGVGEALARRIVMDRASHGPFRSAEDLLRVPGIGWKRLERLRPFVRAGEGA